MERYAINMKKRKGKYKKTIQDDNTVVTSNTESLTLYQNVTAVAVPLFNSVSK